ncbi:hypothetical protein L6452_08472 [Arctium lappa]|uniref:Uncharacterized protein n=1 Tax=Arctium lappa TaxID=4217 RepID=A0ACB9DHU9_ARCLA|nr:hypothetical protein L6452_08472 [Arctium lappa]
MLVGCKTAATATAAATDAIAAATTSSDTTSYTSSAIFAKWHKNELPDYYLRCIPTHLVGRDRWGLLLGLQGSGWLETDHIDGWVWFIRESRPPNAGWTVMLSEFIITWSLVVVRVPSTKWRRIRPLYHGGLFSITGWLATST